MRRTVTTLLSALAMIAVGVVGALAVGGTGTVDPPPKIAFLANGINPADAVAAGSIAGQLGAPVFTTRAEVLEAAARTGLVAYDAELIIVLGGPVAIADSVLNELATATGLTVVPATGSPTAGIVRAAGETRFDTAAEVAKLVKAYAPAFLPVDATALGAVEATRADQADDADQLDGKDSTDFAASGQACTAGHVVTGIAADGTTTCAPDQDEIDGGDAETLDGNDSTDFAASGQACPAGHVVTGIAADGTTTCTPDQDEIDGGDAETLDGLDGVDVSFPTTLPVGRTLTGFYGIADRAAFANDYFGEAINFGVLLPSPPTRLFVPVGGSNATCTGSPTGPTAPEGVLCVYEAFNVNLNDFFSYGTSANGYRFGTLITLKAVAAGGVISYGTWAVTGGTNARAQTIDTSESESERARG